MKSKLHRLKPVLLRFLGFEFDQSNYAALYVYYLSELIERKKILCSIDCDYTGVMNEVRLIAGYLRHLEEHYKKKGEKMRQRESRIQGEQKRMFTEESTNPLMNCPEYQRLKQTIEGMTGEEIGVGSMYERPYGFSEARRVMNVEEKRKSTKERYSGNEFFREEFGY